MGTANCDVDSAKRRSEVVEWLNYLFPDLNMTSEASEEELRAKLVDGTIFSAILSSISPGYAENLRGSYASSKHQFTNITSFISAMELMGLPSFTIEDLEQRALSAVVECLLSLKDRLSSGTLEYVTSNPVKSANQLRKKWNLSEDDRSRAMEIAEGNHVQGGLDSAMNEEERNFSDLHASAHEPVTTEGHFRHVGHEFYENFQLKQGHFSGLPAAKIAEMLRSTSLDSAPTQSLLSVVNGILDENIHRKNGEMPQRVALLLRRVVQEIERRMSTQAEHMRNQNNLIKAREEKYQSRIGVLETLANGAIEETKIVMEQMHLIKIEKSKIEESNRLCEQDLTRLMKEKENLENMISELNRELERTTEIFEHQCEELEYREKKTKAQLDAKVEEVKFLVTDSEKKIKELEEATQLKYESWSKKEATFRNFISLHLHSVKDLRTESESIRQEMMNCQQNWRKQVTSFGQKLKVLVDAAENYHLVLAENQKLFNEVQDLKGNIRVYCRIRPFLPGQDEKLTTIEYIGENGEILIVNPSKPGKEGQRMFKFNKVFGPTASQAEVFSDVQPLIRSVLDGYNICIFAYGQTGSGKTYTMTGPTSASVEDWGVNYRALNDLFDISQNRKNSCLYEVGVQMVEVYNEQVRDLLSDDGPQKRLGIWSTTQPNGLAVPEASMHPVRSTSDVLQLMQIGQSNRAVGSTALNERSSRSHSVLTVHVRGIELKTGSTSRGCLHLIDLAGSERVERSEATGDRLKEAQHINKSLSALGDVIFALAQKSNHIPYRNSKLTQVLQSSLGGQAKTLMFVQINPDVQSYSETISTLKFAERVSGVELGAARSNKEGKDIKDLLDQVASLKEIIGKKDDEIDQLQFLKHHVNQSPLVTNERYPIVSLRHSTSSPGIQSAGITNKQDQSLSSWRLIRHADRAVSDADNSFESSEKFHDIDGGGIVPSSHAETEERLSDISDVISMGKETDDSVSSIVEAAPERLKGSLHNFGSSNVRPGQMSSTRLRTKDSLSSNGTKKTITSHSTGSSIKGQRRL